MAPWPLLILILLPALALADSVKLGGFWIDNVTVKDVTEGRLLYESGNGDPFERDLFELEGLKLTSIPALADAADAVDAKDFAAAAAAYEKALSSAKPVWLKNWINAQLSDAYNRVGEPEKAADSFYRLVTGNANEFYFTSPPNDALDKATNEQRKRIAKKFGDAAPRLKGAAAEAAKKVLERIPFVEETPAAPVGGTTPDANAPAPAAATGPAVVLSRTVPEDDPVAQLVRAGKFEEAIAKADEALASKERRYSLWFYLKGVSQLQLALRDNDEALLKSAGLNLMRSVVYFGRGGSAVTAACRIEVGLVHLKLNRPDIAAKQFEAAGLLIDEESEPELYARLEKLRAGQIE